MIPLDLAGVAAAAGGRLVAGADSSAIVTSVTIDSRTVAPGVLFVALPGTRVDGHDFAAAACAAGAVAVLAARDTGVPAVLVDDPEAALGRLAAHVRRTVPGLVVVGLTGSSGKTSTKDLLRGLLARLGPTVAAPGSYNNDIGLPLTLLSATAQTRFLVAEMGARGAGHIGRLARIAAPDVGVVLNVGSAHLGEFGSREAIAAAKGELVEALPAEGLAVLAADDPRALAMAERTAARVLTFGLAETADARAEDVTLDARGCASFTLRAGAAQAPVRLDLVGAHQVHNALAAALVALELGLPLDEAAAGLAAARLESRWRMEVTAASAATGGVTVVNDAYNANPESTRAALQTLASMARASGGRSVAVLAEMAELGEAAAEAHDAIGRLAVRLDISRLVAVGDPAGPVGRLHAGAVLEGSWADESVLVVDVDAAIALLRAELRPGDIVLVKGSRSTGMERVAFALTGEVPA